MSKKFKMTTNFQNEENLVFEILKGLNLKVTFCILRSCSSCSAVSRSDSSKNCLRSSIRSCSRFWICIRRSWAWLRISTNFSCFACFSFVISRSCSWRIRSNSCRSRWAKEVNIIVSGKLFRKWNFLKFDKTVRWWLKILQAKTRKFLVTAASQKLQIYHLNFKIIWLYAVVNWMW